MGREGGRGTYTERSDFEVSLADKGHWFNPLRGLLRKEMAHQTAPSINLIFFAVTRVFD